jgi:hypothetical protein
MIVRADELFAWHTFLSSGSWIGITAIATKLKGSFAVNSILISVDSAVLSTSEVEKALLCESCMHLWLSDEGLVHVTWARFACEHVMWEGLTST